MIDLFKKAMVVSTAVASFYGGAQIVSLGLDSHLASKVKAITAANTAMDVKVDEAVNGNQK